MGIKSNQKVAAYFHNIAITAASIGISWQARHCSSLECTQLVKTIIIFLPKKCESKLSALWKLASKNETSSLVPAWLLRILCLKYPNLKSLGKRATMRGYLDQVDLSLGDYHGYSNWYGKTQTESG